MQYNKSISKTIKPEKLEFSLLFITPKKSFIEWLDTFQKQKGLENYESIHLSEEDSVWLIPKIEWFSEPSSYDHFLNDLKPRLLLWELGNFGASPEDFGKPLDQKVFDAFFDITLRTEATLISELF